MNARRLTTRGGTLVVASLISGACLIPEYRITEDGSGGGNNDGGTSGSGGAPSSGATSSSSGATTGSGGSSTGGGTGGGTDSGGQGGEGGAPPAWSCADEESNPPAYYSNGTFCGYRFTFWFPTSGPGTPTVNPTCQSSNGSDCFRTDFEHLTGTLPASADPIYPSLGIGMSIRQASVGSAKQTWELEGYGIEVDYNSDGATVPGRIQLTMDGDTYCATAMRSTPLAWEDFRLECWNTSQTATLQAGDPVEELHLALTSAAEQQTISNLDFETITLLPSEPPFECDGCAKLFVPFGAGAQNVSTEYNLDLGAPYDLSDPLIRMVARVLVKTAATTGGIQIILRSMAGTAYVWHQLADVEGWHDLEIAPSQAPTAGGLNLAAVTTIGFQVTSGMPPNGAVTADATVYVDSIEFTGPVPAGLIEGFTFDTDLQGLTHDMTNDVDDSTLEWVSLP